MPFPQLIPDLLSLTGPNQQFFFFFLRCLLPSLSAGKQGGERGIWRRRFPAQQKVLGKDRGEEMTRPAGKWSKEIIVVENGGEVSNTIFRFSLGNLQKLSLNFHPLHTISYLLHFAFTPTAALLVPVNSQSQLTASK